MSAAAARSLLASIHDVTPAHADRIARIHDLFARHAVTRYALLVVPHYHGAWRLDEHPAFVDDLRMRREAGAEIFLHGLRHDEVGLRRTWSQHVRAAGRTSGEGEFLSLSASETAGRIDRGLAVLRACGLDPVGFIPPAWLFGRSTIAILKRYGLTITEGIVAVTDLETGRRIVAPPLAWDTRARWLARACTALVAARRRAEERRPVVRLAIHPPDIDDPVTGPSVAVTLDTVLRSRAAVSYQEALASP